MPTKEKLEFGEECYLAYQNTAGASWSLIGDLLGVSANYARSSAKAFRRKFRKAWPPLLPGDPRRRDSPYYTGPLEGADLAGRKVAPGIVIAPWHETLDKWDVLL